MTSAALTASSNGAPDNVSRETRERLAIYVDLLGRWNARINLVSASTMADPWQRHIWDSAQLLPDALAVGGRMADLGSGAGLPGLILAIMGRPTVALLESDQRKCAFLREAARATATEVIILQGRMEALPPADATLVTARACAPLDRLLAHAMRHLVAGGTALFLKGRSADEEIAEARKTWTFDVHRRPSTTDPEACVLRLENISRG
ncbi:16S rRNA m(7)G-527 methyltransferase [Stella humosa]|uniref:Ribosomal RNA small subunit methyltransferase G n=1 Tax=Stella humosa TaxID=94 RepID=A0A3N1LKJ2_9PROT|nr:16S rRNA (guanine(527)-N(7))-methyltransferase RsmG [Stella humosa]ROP90946.1 16S rRNA m(7)G-527 methyltransferase [Stella humosa]BBK34704.1 ribosomal RNA small subunit methyltransferase G [Stella humosa]